MLTIRRIALVINDMLMENISNASVKWHVKSKFWMKYVCQGYLGILIDTCKQCPSIHMMGGAIPTMQGKLL
jgi:hypothetical protein